MGRKQTIITCALILIIAGGSTFLLASMTTSSTPAYDTTFSVFEWGNQTLAGTPALGWLDLLKDGQLIERICLKRTHTSSGDYLLRGSPTMSLTPDYLTNVSFSLHSRLWNGDFSFSITITRGPYWYDTDPYRAGVIMDWHLNMTEYLELNILLQEVG